MTRISLLALLVAMNSPGLARAQAPAPGLAQMSEPGTEEGALQRRAGHWAVTETVWDHPGADPARTSGLLAERRMVGAYLEETLIGAGDAAAMPQRIDYLGFDRLNGRWDYVSLDTRALVPLMPAWSFDRGEADRIVVRFLPFAVPGSGPGVVGQMLRMEEVITRDGADRDSKDQFFILANGSGTRWLAHRYEYVRQR